MELLHHAFEFNFRDRKIVRELDVPFTSGEILTLESFRAIKEGWSQEALKGSGLLRELYMDLVDIPWAMSLIDRNKALTEIRQTVENIRMVREKYGASSSYAPIEGDLSKVEEGLLQFVPEMKKKKK